MAEFKPVEGQIKADTLVVGGTSAISGRQSGGHESILPKTLSTDLRH